jgi:O-antigen ligase
MIFSFDKIISIFLLAILVFAALAHGAVEPWSVSLCAAGLIALFGLWSLKLVFTSAPRLHLPETLWPLLGLILWGLLQGWSRIGDAGQRISLSLDAEATHTVTFWLLLMTLMFLVAANSFLRFQHLVSLSRFLVYYGMALALFGLVQKLTWDGRFYWMRYIDTEEIMSPFGPFVHHGHYAGYIEMLLPMPMAMLVMRCVPSEHRYLYGIAATLMGLSVIVSLSRGGMISFAIQMLFLGWMGTRLTNRQSDYASRSRSGFRLALTRVGALVAIIAAIGLSVFWMGAEPVINRVLGQATNSTLSSEELFFSRGWIWRDAWAMFRAHPITGVGYGAFGTAYSAYTESDGSVRVNEAHNDYLQVLSDGGLIAGGLVLWFLIAVGRQVYRGLNADDPLRVALTLGAATGIVGLLVHSFFDFNLQLPAQALLFVLLVAVIAQCGLPARQRSTV